jgi:hypothetical protein
MRNVTVSLDGESDCKAGMNAFARDLSVSAPVAPDRTEPDAGKTEFQRLK